MPAIALSALVFGLMHLGNQHATALSVAGNAMGGVMYGLAFVWSGRLCLPIGLHFAWNLRKDRCWGFQSAAMTWAGCNRSRMWGRIG
jgi:hypothetical protein